MENSEKRNWSLQQTPLAIGGKQHVIMGKDTGLGDEAIGGWIVEVVEQLNITVFIVRNQMTGWYLQSIANTIDNQTEIIHILNSSCCYLELHNLVEWKKCSNI